MSTTQSPWPGLRSGGILQLHYSDKGSVTITPDDQDRFNLRVKRVIEACQEAVDLDAFKEQLRFLMKQLYSWASSRNDIQDAYLTLRDGSLLFLVVRKSGEYDADFEDALSDLDIAIANDGDLRLMKMQAMALPVVSDESLASFLDESTTWAIYYGERDGACGSRQSQPSGADLASE